MNPEDVGRILDEIGERIGPAGEYAWTLTVRQVVIDASMWGGVGVVLILVALACGVGAALSRGELRANAAVIGAFAFIVAVPVVVFVGTQLLNPEYHAMMRLLDRMALGR
ncbi:MAG: hypothetical protein ABR593_10110 [Candidatus Limnocylindria bacterium]